MESRSTCHLLMLFACVGMLALSPVQANAKNSKWYQTRNVNFEISLPDQKRDQWLVGPLLGFPLMVLGPSQNGFRPTLSFTPELTPTNKTFDMNVVEQQIGFYKNGRTNYVKNRNGTIKEFFAPSKIPNNNNLAIYAMGYNYTLDNLNIIERSLRFVCDGYVVMAMARYYPEHHPDAEKQLNDVLSELKCRKKTKRSSK